MGYIIIEYRTPKSVRLNIKQEDDVVLENLSQFTVGKKVKITYNGTIMESYPAQIK